MSASDGVFRSPAGERAVRERYARHLDRWPLPHERLRVQTGQGETFVVACGPPAAPPLLLLHGSGANAAMWLGDVAAWARFFRVYAVDVIGEPGNSAPSRPPLDSDAHARWLDDTLDALGVRTTSIVGVSLGGWLALDYAIRRPGRVDRMALLCPGGVGRQRLGAVLAAALVSPFGRRGKLLGMRLVLGRTPPPSTPEAREFTEFMLLIQRQFRYRRDRLPVFGDDALRGLRPPTLVVLGGRDAMLDSRDTRRRLERHAPQATVRLLPEAGHLLLGQTEPILEFLRPTEGDER